VISTYDCGDRLDCKQVQPVLPTEPFGMELDTGSLANGTDYARLAISHLASGQVTVIDAKQDNPQYAVLNVSPSFFAADNTGRRGAFGLAPQHPHDPSSTWYMTSNLQPVLATFRIAQVGVVVPSLSFSISGAFALGGDVRDIAFEPGGNRAFLTENNPPSVLVLDTRVTPERNPGQPINQLVDIVDVCQTPSHMGVRRRQVAGAPGTPDHVHTDLYVICFLSNQVMVVDPDAPGVEDTILVGRGPNDVAFNFGDSDDPDAPPAPPARRAYVSQYSEMTIGVIDADPGSPTQNRMIARIGKPLPPPNGQGQTQFSDINYNTNY
jgi:YVTN family beta-propeller protein